MLTCSYYLCMSMHSPCHLLNMNSLNLVKISIKLTLQTILNLQNFLGPFQENSSLITPLACADFSSLLGYYQNTQPASLLNYMFRNSFIRNLIFENKDFISIVSHIKLKSINKIKKCFDSNLLLSHSFENVFACSNNIPLPLTILKDFDMLFTILKYKQCNKHLIGSTTIMSPQLCNFLLFMIRHCFFSLPRKGFTNNNRLKDLRSILGNIVKFRPPFLPEDTARCLFQISLEFISQCNLYFSKNSKKFMLLLIKVAILLIQRFLTNFPSKPNGHRKKILFMGQKLSSTPFTAFFKSVHHENLKFQLLKYTN